GRRLSFLGDARENPEIPAVRLAAKDPLRSSARGLRDALRVHGESGREHLGKDRQPRPARLRLAEEALRAAVVFPHVLPRDVALKKRDFHLKTGREGQPPPLLS